MSNNLQSVRLGELLISLKTGLNPRDNFKLNTQDADNWYITVRELNGLGVDFLPQTDRVNDHGLKLINNRSNLEIGDVLFSGTGTIGKTAIIDKTPTDWNIKEGVYSLKPKKDKLEPYYLLYLLKHLTRLNVFNKISAGSTVFSVPMKSLEGLTIKIPKLHEQVKVSNVLRALDFKIELNARINATLESMAKTLYDYWFVQFTPLSFGHPPKYDIKSLDNNKNTPVVFGGTEGGLVWNDELKRKIPLGWEVGTLSDIGTITGGSTPPREIDDYFDVNGTAWITPKDLSLNSGNKFITKGETGVSEKGLKVASLTIMPKGTILLSSRAPIGYMAIARESVTTNQGFKSFIPNKGYSIPYIYYTVKNAIPTIINHSTGSTFKEASASVLKSISICLPPVAITERFKENVDAIFERQNKLELESQRLRELRDWLLPMLMNGQVTVK